MTERGSYGYIPRQVLSRSQYNEFQRRLELAFTWLCSQLDESDCHGLILEFTEVLHALKVSDLSQICPANFTIAFVSGQVYCNVCEQLFGLSIAPRELTIFDEILNFLLDRRSHFPVSFSLSALTFSPLHQVSHCAMIEAIMNVHIRTLLTCEQISCSRYEVLSDPKLILSWNHIETVILYWMNEITNRVNKIIRSQPAVTKSCFNSRHSLNTSFETLGVNGRSPSNAIQIPEVEDAAQGISDGQTLLAVLSYHFPNLLPLKAGKFYPLMSFSDCVHNLSLVCDFCTSESYTQNCSNVQPWLLTVEDLLYPNLSLRVHVLNALVQLYLALKAVPEQETLLYQSSQSLKSNSEDSIGSHEGDTDSLNGYNFSQNLRSQSMHSFSRPQNQASMDPAGDALMELESRWKQQKSSRPNLISPSPSSQMSLASATNSEVNLNVGRDKSPRRVQEGRDGMTIKRDKGSTTPRKEDRKPRIPSEDSALGTSSSPSEVSTKTSFSNKKVNNQNNGQQPPIRLEQSDETSLQVESGGKTYSRRSARPQTQRLSVHELTQAYENDLRPLSAMKQGQENLMVQNNEQRSNHPTNDGKSSGNLTSFGSQSNLRARTQSKKRQVSRPKSALDERIFSLSNQNDGEISADDVNSDPEISMATSGLSKRFEEGAQMSSSAKMTAIKLKMEQQRKSIQMERARTEAAKNKQRQTLGKTAFMRVIKGSNSSNNQTESDDCRSTADDSEFSVSDYSPEKSQVVMRRHKTSEDRQSFANRRQRAKSSNLDAVNLQYNGNPDFENFRNDSAASSRRVSAEVQTSLNFDEQRSASAMHGTGQRIRPVSNYIERDDLESFTSGIGSNQSTLRRTKALARPSTAYGDIFQRNENENGDFGDLVTSSVDLRSSLERDMLIEQNQILARELQTLKHKFAVELETRKLQSDQFEMQRKAEQSLQRSRTDLTSQVYASQHVPAHQNTSRIPPTWNQTAHGMVPNDRLPPVSTSVMNHNQVNPLAGHQSLNRHQSNPPFNHASVQNPASSMYPNYGSQQAFPVHHGNQNFQLASSRPQSMYAMQGLQPPYAVHDNEAYHNFETTHNQEYHYETLHGSHHNYYHQHPPPVSSHNPYAQPPTSVYQHQVYSSSQVPVQSQSNMSENQQNISNDGQFLRSRSNSALSSNLNTSPRQMYDVASNDNVSNMNANLAKPKAKRPLTLDMRSEKGNAKGNEKKQGEGNLMNRSEKDRATAYDSSSAISPLDPDIRISSSVEVTPENSPVHQNRSLVSDTKIRSPQNPNSRVQYDSGDGTLNTSNLNGASNPYHQKETSNKEKSSISPNPVFDDPPSQPSAQVNQPKKAEAFSVNFFNSPSTNSASQPPPLKSNRFNNPQRRSKNTGDKTKPLSANAHLSNDSNHQKQDKDSGIGSHSSASSRRVTSAPTRSKEIGQPNREEFSTSSSTTVDEALKIVQEGELSSTIDLGRRKGGLALVIDVDSFGTKNSPLTPGGGTPKDSSAASIVATEGANTQSPLVDDQKRKERELQFLRRQNEKQQRDLEKRRKMTEQANQQGQERQLKESLAQEQKKLEAAARRERIMAQYLEKKRQKELEEKGLASSHGQAVAKGVIGGGPQGFAFVTAGDGSSGKTGGGGAPKLGTPKHRSKSTTADNTSATQGSKQSRSRKGSASDKQQKQKLERKNSAGGGGGMALSRSRKNSVENLLSDGESIVSTMDNWDAKSEFSEYSGPKLFVKPSSKSNKQKIQNAITQSVFPGAVNSEMKNKILQQLDVACVSGGSDVSESGAGKHFLVLFRDHSLKYRAIYLCDGDCSQGVITKIVGMGPTSVKLNMIQDLYKYDSGGKRFIQIPAKTMSVSVDAFTIHNQLWKKKSIAS